jgi:hypothetical protein
VQLHCAAVANGRDWPRVVQGRAVTFQPFGYRFEVVSFSPPAAVRAAIRSRAKPWFDLKDGARGWIVGPFICLWFSAVRRGGPILVGRIARHGTGTRIAGRAGCALAYAAIACAVLAFAPWLLWRELGRGADPATAAVLTGLGVAAQLLILWIGHRFRREAEPLVRFLRDTLTPPDRSLPRPSFDAGELKGVILDVGGTPHQGPVTTETLHQALSEMGEDDFVILSSAPETYIQTAIRDGDYVIEKRDGSGERHFAARRVGPAPEVREDLFSFDEVREIFLAYAAAAPMPPLVRWERMRF